MRLLLIGLILVLGIGSAEVGFAFSDSPPTGPCVDILAKTPSGPLLLKSSAKIREGLDPSGVNEWETDFLVAAGRDLIQLPTQCRSRWRKLLDHVSEAYLRRVGGTYRLDWFKALASDNPQSIRKRLGDPPKLEQVYRHQTRIRAIWVFSQQPVKTEAWEKLVSNLCRKQACPLWHPDFIFRVQVVEPRNVAAYTPELATLTLSRHLFEKPTLQAVHELIHAAVQWGLRREQKDWVAEFSKISGWNRKGKRRWVTPGVPVNGIRVGSKTYEGFCYARSFTRSVQSGPEEDLADHGAAYFLDPGCFCKGKKMKLAQKWEWLSAHFPSFPPPCL